jgi:hypothetical protein
MKKKITKKSYKRYTGSDDYDEVLRERTRKKSPLKKGQRRFITAMNSAESVHPTTRPTRARIPPRGWYWTFKGDLPEARAMYPKRKK